MVARSVAKRLVHPGHLMRAIKLQRARKRTKVAFADAELELFAQIMPTGFCTSVTSTTSIGPPSR